MFRTAGDGEPDTVWVIAARDEGSRTVQFVRFTPGLRSCVLDLAVRPGPGAASRVDVRYTYTALSDAGAASLGPLTGDGVRGAREFWEASMNHWLATGETLPRAAR